MKKKQKISYGVYNIIEWHALIPMGKAVVKIPFTGGAITTSGVTPATFTTTDPIVQFAIERSAEFKSGKIKVVRKVTLNEEIVIEQNAPKHQDAPLQESAPVLTEADTHVAEPEQKDSTVNVEAEPQSPADVEAEPQSPADVEAALIDKEFDNNEDAKEFLADNYGILKSKMRKRDEIMAAGKGVGVNIIFV